MPPRSRVLLVSVRPRFAALLLTGEKTVELRRVAPTVQAGATIAIYASSPTCELVGTGNIVTIATASPESIWDSHGHRTGLTRPEFDAYFDGASTAAAIEVEDVKPLPSQRSLAELRERLSGFRPPQSFRYLTPGQLAALI